MDYIAQAKEMRSAAWAELIASPAFKAFRAADNMVVELGGGSVMPDLSTPKSAGSDASGVGSVVIRQRPRIRVRNPDGGERVTQGDAAEKVLRANGPLGIVDLSIKAEEIGAVVGGSNPIGNFRSAMSKDERFYSFRHDGNYLWWLTGVALPDGWDEAADDLLRAAAPSDANQEGGDSHAATMP